MSLEQALAAQTAAITDNTTALNALIAAWTKLATQGKNIAQGVENGTVTKTTAGNITIPLAKAEVALPVLDKAEAKKPVATPPAPVTVTPAPAVETAPAEVAAASPSEAAEPITYAQVSKAITDGVKVNRDHVLATLAKFGVKKGPELKVEQYVEFLAAL